jgi:hypothetical protein
MQHGAYLLLLFFVLSSTAEQIMLSDKSGEKTYLRQQ